MVFIGSIHVFTVMNDLSVKLGGIFIHFSTHTYQGIEPPIHSILPHLKASRAYRLLYTPNPNKTYTNFPPIFIYIGVHLLAVNSSCGKY